MRTGCLVAAVVVLVALVLVGAAGGGYWYYTTTPTYAVRQIEAAIRAHDVERFETYVDLDAVLGDAFDQLVAAERGRDDRPGAWDEAGRAIGQALLKPPLVARMKKEVLAAVESGRPPASATFSARPTLGGIERVKRRGALAEAGLRIQDGRRSYVAEVRLRRHGRGWQAVSITNLAEIVAEYRRAAPGSR